MCQYKSKNIFNFQSEVGMRKIGSGEDRDAKTLRDGEIYISLLQFRVFNIST